MNGEQRTAERPREFYHRQEDSIPGGEAMTTTGSVERAREAFAAHAWGDAYRSYVAADRETPLGPADLENLATAAYLTGRDAESDDCWSRAHRQWLDEREVPRAARCGFWLSFTALLRGEEAHSTGWLARTQRMLDEHQLDCVERGYLLVIVGLPEMAAGHTDTAHTLFREAAELAERFGDSDLLNLARLSMGEALIQGRHTTEGVRLLDELMLDVAAGEVSPIQTGIAYCATILACQKLFDVRRATEWTTALTNWCATQEELVPFRGQCLVHRSELLQLHGRWPDAVAEAERACELLVGPPSGGAAHYQRGELLRLRGELAQAEMAYREANAQGYEPQPGLSLLRLTQGDVETAAAAMRRVTETTADIQGPTASATRSRLLPAYVETMLAAHDLGAARAGAEELAALAADLDVPLLHAASAQTTGAVLLAENDPAAALDRLRVACTTWQDLHAPYDMARVQVLMGIACRQLGDYDTGQMHLDDARAVFGKLGARPDLARLEKLTLKTAPGAAGLLTPREIEVLRLVAAGRSNRAVATELFLSEKTVARHVSNILGKLGVGSRSAATAYAYEHGLL